MQVCDNICYDMYHLQLQLQSKDKHATLVYLNDFFAGEEEKEAMRIVEE